MRAGAGCQLPFCASSPVPTCPAPLSTLPIHWMPFGRPAAPLGQESIWSSGATYQDASIAGVGDTKVHLPTSHLPTHNCHLTQQLRCPNCIFSRGHLASNYLHTPRSHKGIRRPGSDNKIYVCILLKVLIWCTTTVPHANATF